MATTVSYRMVVVDKRGRPLPFRSVRAYVNNNLADSAVDIDCEDGSTLNATILGNTIFNAGTGIFHIEAESTGGNVCLDLNAANVGADANSCNTEFFLERVLGTFAIEGIGAGGPFTNAQVETFLDPRNTTEVLTPVGGGFTDIAACPMPPAMPAIP